MPHDSDDIDPDDPDGYLANGPPNHKLKRPCSNCPFRAKGASALAPGRVAGIIKTLETDTNYFQCHKTTYSRTTQESVCMGALAFMFRRNGRLPIISRLAVAFNELTIPDLQKCFPLLINEKDIL